MVLRRLMLPLRLLVSGGLLAYLIWRANPGAIWREWQAVSLRLLGLAILLQFVAVAVNAAKWRMQLLAHGQHQPYRWLLGAFMAGQFANNFLPTTIGGDALRIAQLGRRIGSYAHASASVFFDRLTGFLVLSVAAGMVLLAYRGGFAPVFVATPPLFALLTAGFALVALVTLGVAVLAPRLPERLLPHLPGALRRPLQRVADAMTHYTPRGAALVQIVLMSVVYQGVWMSVHVVCGLALGLQVPLLLYALMVPMTDMVGMAPIFFNNLGAREWVFSLYLQQIGIAQNQAIALSLLVFSVRLVVSVAGGVIVLFGGADLSSVPDDRRPTTDDRLVPDIKTR